MRHALTLPALFLPALLATSTAAQQLCVTGLVEKGAAFSICASRASHQFRCANLRLVSTAVSLARYQGQVVELCGTVRLLGACRTMTVTRVRTAVDGLRITGPTGGKIQIGKKVSFDFSGMANRVWLLFFSGNRGWTPSSLGVVLLRSPFTFVTNGFLGNNGKASLPLQIPNNPSLINADAFFQAGFIDIVKPAAAFANSDCFRITR